MSPRSSRRSSCGRSSRTTRRSPDITSTSSTSTQSATAHDLAFTVATKILSYEGAHEVLEAAVAKARDMGVPQCISVVDAGGHLLAFARMDGAFAMSMQTSLMKAKTAASYGE